MLDCDSTLDLVPALLLDVLEADEVLAVREHLSVCAKCQAEAEALRPVAGVLGLAAPEAAVPSPRVKQRLMAQIGAKAKQPKAVTRWFWRPLPIFATAATVLVLVLGVWAYSAQAQLTAQQARLDRLTAQQAALRQFMIDGEMRPVPVQFESQPAAAAVLYTDADRVAMAVDGLPPLKGEEVYQCWWKKAQKAVAGTAFRVDDRGSGLWVWKKPEGDDFDEMLISREPRTGADQQTGPVILTANLK